MGEQSILRLLSSSHSSQGNESQAQQQEAGGLWHLRAGEVVEHNVIAAGDAAGAKIAEVADLGSGVLAQERPQADDGPIGQRGR